MPDDIRPEVDAHWREETVLLERICGDDGNQSSEMLDFLFVLIFPPAMLMLIVTN